MASKEPRGSLDSYFYRGPFGSTLFFLKTLVFDSLKILKFCVAPEEPRYFLDNLYFCGLFESTLLFAFYPFFHFNFEKRSFFENFLTDSREKYSAKVNITVLSWNSHDASFSNVTKADVRISLNKTMISFFV